MIIEAMKSLQKEISIFLVSLVIAIILIVVSQVYWQSIFDEKQFAEEQLFEAKERYHTALDRKRMLKEFENKYKILDKQGVVGDEKRLNWIDVIEKTTKQEKIPYVKYKIDKQDPVNNPQLKGQFPGIEIYQSAMSLEMDLLHEGDLYTVLNNLHKNAKGLFDVSECNLSRNSSAHLSILDTNTDKNFSARCQLNWFTMKAQTVNAMAYSDDENENE